MMKKLAMKVRTRQLANVQALLAAGINSILEATINIQAVHYKHNQPVLFQVLQRHPLASVDCLDEVMDYFDKRLAEAVRIQIPHLDKADIAQVHDMIFGLRVENGSIKGLDIWITLRLMEVPLVPIEINLFVVSTADNIADIVDILLNEILKNYPQLDSESIKATVFSRLYATKVRMFFNKETFNICTTPTES